MAPESDHHHSQAGGEASPGAVAFGAYSVASVAAVSESNTFAAQATKSASVLSVGVWQRVLLSQNRI